MPEFLSEAEFTPKGRNYASGPRGPRARSDEQKPWDAAFKAAMNGSGFLHAQIKPEDAEESRKHVAAAARLFGLATTEGVARTGKAKGTVILSWRLRPVVKRQPKADETTK